MNVIQKDNFDPDYLLNRLIQVMGFEQEAPEKVTQLKENLAFRLHNKLFNAVSQSIEPEIVEQAIKIHGEEKAMWQFILKVVAMSPAANKAMTEAIDQFMDETLEAYEILAKTA